MSKKGTDTFGTEIGGTVGLRGRHDDGIRQDGTVTVHATLQITKQALSIGNVV